MPDTDEPPGTITASVPRNAQIVQIEEVYKEAHLDHPGATAKASPPTFTQRAGLQLALGVGGLIAVVTVIVIIDWVRGSPPRPNISLSAPEAEAAMKNYRALVDAVNARSTTFFDSIVTKALLPIFTAIVGYIFGARSSDQNSSKTTDSH